MSDKNVYGYWEFTDVIGLGCGIDKRDLAYVFKVKNEMAHALNEKGRVISFHVTNITKHYFCRPYKPQCRGQIERFKKVVKRFESTDHYRKMNVYGYWQYRHRKGLACNVRKYDLVYIYKIKGERLFAINERGRKIIFCLQVLKNIWLERPSYEHHKECELGKSSAQFNRNLFNDCHKCQMHKFKKTIKRFKTRKESL